MRRTLKSYRVVVETTIFTRHMVYAEDELSARHAAATEAQANIASPPLGTQRSTKPRDPELVGMLAAPVVR